MGKTEQIFEGRTFKSSSVSALNFVKNEFTGCDLSEYKLFGSAFVDCRFIDCNLSNIKVDGCSFRHVAFEGCKLVGVVFVAVNPFLLDWSFQKCKIEMCDFSAMRMKRSRFIECLVHKTDFINANLSESDFSGSDLDGSKFHHTILEKASFIGASRYYINPADNKLKQAKFSSPEVFSLLAPFEIKVED